MPWSYLTLAALLLAGALLLIGGVMVVAVRMILRPPRMTDGKASVVLQRLSPGDLDLPFQNVRFPVDDAFDGGSIPIVGWWIEADHPADRCVILLHGYSDAKVGAIAWAPMFHRMGYNLLAVDLRAHGESGGRYCSAGFYERDDLSQVIDQLRALHPDGCRHLILFGVSLGAAVAAATAARRNDVEAVIMDSPYADFTRAAATHARVWGMPRGRLLRLVMARAQRIARADFSAVAPVKLLAELNCPVMVIRGGRDFLVDDADDARLRAALQRRTPEQGRTVYWAIPEAGHILGLARRPVEYPRKIAAFLDARDDPPLQPVQPVAEPARAAAHPN